jgi:hypothetical protein
MRVEVLGTIYIYISVAFSPQANCTEWPTATGRLILVPYFVGVAWSARLVPTAVNLGFLDRSRYFFFQVAPHLSSRGWVDPVPDPLLLRKSDSAGNRTRDHWVWSQELLTTEVAQHIYIYIARYISERLFTENHWVSGHCPSSGCTAFRKLDLFPSSGEGRET